jgi:iron complex outermembrane receptor protein
MSLGAHVANALVLDAFSIDAQTTKAAKGTSPEVLLVHKWVCWITMTL